MSTLIKRFAMLASKIFPKNFQKRMARLLIYAGIKTNENEYIGRGILLSAAISAAIITVLALITGIELVGALIIIGAFMTTLGLTILYPYFLSERRAKSVEASLPDFFNVTASNMRSGDTLLTAMFDAAKEGFGVLGDEVKSAVSLSMGTESYEVIMNTLVKNIKSKIMGRVADLLTVGIRRGGNIPSLLEGAAEEVTQMFVLKKELVTSIRSYMLFIVIIVAIGLPFLLNISTYFVQTIKGLETKITPSQITPGVSASSITVEFLTTLSYIIITATSLFASMLIGAVIDESFIQGLKYFLPLVAISMIVYILSSSIIPSVLGGLNVGL